MGTQILNKISMISTTTNGNTQEFICVAQYSIAEIDSLSLATELMFNVNYAQSIVKKFMSR